MSRLPAVGVLLAVTALAWPASASSGTGPLSPYLDAGGNGRCPRYADLRVCSGQVPSFDGSKMDVDVTEPMGPPPRRARPLIVMVHGAGGPDATKREFESVTDAANGADRYDWNTHWFARHGYYVLTFTQRGYR